MGRRTKCIVFDLDHTLWLPSKRIAFDLQRAATLKKHLYDLKRKYELFLAVASFNLQAKEVTEQLFSTGLFDIVTCCSPDIRFDKSSLLQRVRKAYAVTHPSQKLKWDEMAFYDDMDEVLERLQQTLPKVTLIPVNGKVGLTIMALERLSECS